MSDTIPHIPSIWRWLNKQMQSF